MAKGFLNAIKNPFATIGTQFESLTQHMMGGFSFWLLLIVNGLLVAIAIVAVILVLIGDFSTGFELNSASYEDPRSFNMFPYTFFLGGVGLYGVALALGGAMLFVSDILRWLIALTFGLGSIAGSMLLILPQIKAWGRLNSCLNDQKGTTFCKRETGWLVAVGILTLLMLLIGLVNIVWVVLVLFSPRVRKEAMGAYHPWFSEKKREQANQDKLLMQNEEEPVFSQMTNRPLQPAVRSFAKQFSA